MDSTHNDGLVFPCRFYVCSALCCRGFNVCLVSYVAAGTGDRNLLLSLGSRKVGVMLETMPQSMVKQKRNMRVSSLDCSCSGRRPLERTPFTLCVMVSANTWSPLLPDWIIHVGKCKIIYFPLGARGARVRSCHIAPANLKGSGKSKQRQKQARARWSLLMSHHHH